MRAKLAIVLVGIVWVASGCAVSHRIVQLPPRGQPPLQALDQHLTYTDRYAGRTDYIVPQR